MSTLFRAVGIQKALQLYAGLLDERKTVFVSKHYSLLTIAAETLTQLMAPFRWHHIYIPILPADLLAFLEAPTPFIVGVHADYQPCMDDFQDVTVVDLDAGEVKFEGQPALLPPAMLLRLTEKLRRILDPQLVDMDLAFPPPPAMASVGASYGSCAMAPQGGDQWVNSQLKLAFMQEWIRLFKDYAGYISFIRKFPEPVTIFNKARYIKDRPEAVVFLTTFLETQAFAMFLEMHHEEVASPFDRIIRAQLRGMSSTQILLDSAFLLHNPSVFPPPSTLFKSDCIAPLASPTTSSPRSISSALFPKLQNDRIPSSVSLTNLESAKPPSTSSITRSQDSVASCEGKKESAAPLDADGSFIEECIDRVLSEKPLSRDRAEFFEDLLKLETSRVLFAGALKRASILGLVELKQVFFDQLVALSRRFLLEANGNNDFSSPTVFLYVMGCFKVEGENDDYLYNHTKDLAIWQNKYFWEAAFFEAVAQERYQLSSEYMVGQPMAVPWASLTEQERSELQTCEANLLFGVLGTFGYHMLKSGISTGEASSFLLQMCRLCDIDNDQANDLQTLVKNMAHINETLEPVTYTKEQKRAMEEGGAQGFKLEYFAVSSKRADDDSAALYRRLMEQKVKDDFGIRTLYGHKKGISTMAILWPLLASGSVDGEVRLWNMEEHSYSPFRFQAHSERITSVLLTRELLITASQDARVIVWSQETGKIIYDFCSHTSAVNSIHLKNGMLVSGSDDSLVKGRRISLLTKG
jgi:hypothetical protein